MEPRECERYELTEDDGQWIFVVATRIDESGWVRDPEVRDATEGEVDQRRGFHCLSLWDGSHPGVKQAVKRLLSDLDSFEHEATYISPVDHEGQHELAMQSMARNAHGAMVSLTAEATIQNDGCGYALTDIQ